MQMDTKKLANTLSAPDCEGRVPYAYPDSEGYLTIGVGHLIDKRRGGRLSDAVINQILREDISNCVVDLDREVPWWTNNNDCRQRAMAELCFNLGIKGLLGFKKMLAAWQTGDYLTAAEELKDSKWWSQIQASRKERLFSMIQTGEDL